MAYSKMCVMFCVQNEIEATREPGIRGHCGLFEHKFAPIVLFFSLFLSLSLSVSLSLSLSLSFVEKIYTSVVA